MQKIIFYLILFITIFNAKISTAQVIKGFLVDENSKEVLQRATIYQDGTTNVTFTDDKGFFQLDLRGLKNTLVAQFIGYESKRIENPAQFADQTLRLSLNVASFSLDEVVISRQHSFTRKQMLQAFKREFLGSSKAALSCKIENEKGLMFIYDEEEQILTATSKQPLQIINKYLEYEIMYDLKEFIVYFSNSRSLARAKLVTMYMDRNSYYIDRSKRNRAEKKRYKSYLGSIPHFVHALVYDKMSEQKWKLLVDGKVINPKEYFEITDTLQEKKIKLMKKPEAIMREINSEDIFKFKKMRKDAFVDSNGMVRVPAFFIPFYDGKLQSMMEFESSVIYVDANGNFMPNSGVGFGGYMGRLRAGDLLPLDYLNTIKNRVAVDEKSIVKP